MSSDGKNILIEDISPEEEYFRSYLVNVETKVTTAVDWPGRARRVIAFVAPKRILYFGLTTTGQKAKTIVDSPLWGRKVVPAIKIADLETGEFQTVIDELHPYSGISFGQPKQDCNRNNDQTLK